MMFQLSREEKLEKAREKLQRFRDSQQHPVESQSISLERSTNHDTFQWGGIPPENGCSHLTQNSPSLHEGDSFPKFDPFTASLEQQHKAATDYSTHAATFERVAQLSQQLNQLSASVVSEAGTPESASGQCTDYYHLTPLNDNHLDDFRPRAHPPCQTPQVPPTDGTAVGVSSGNSSRTPSRLSLPASLKAASLPFQPSSASAILIRELQQRNVELAALLEQRNETQDRSVAQVASLREQLQRLRISADEAKANLEKATQRELAKARDQVRAHSQTVGALVAEKTELEAKLAHLEHVALSRSREVQEARADANETAARLRDLEDNLRLAQSASEHADAAKCEALRQLELWRSEAKKEKESRVCLQREMQDRADRLDALATELRLANADLSRQLEVALAFSASSKLPGGTATTSALTCSRCVALRARIQELESSGVQTTAEKGRLETRYKAYVSDMERQVQELQVEVETANAKNAALQKSVEDLHRQATERESELTRVVSELEQLRTQQSCEQASIKAAPSSPVSDDLKTPASPRNPDKPTVEAIMTSELYLELKDTAEVLKHKVNEVTQRLSEAEEAAALAASRLADRDAVIAQATSERTALSRAMEQNSRLKEQLMASTSANALPEGRVCTETQTEPPPSLDNDGAEVLLSRISELTAELESSRARLTTTASNHKVQTTPPAVVATAAALDEEKDVLKQNGRQSPIAAALVEHRGMQTTEEEYGGVGGNPSSVETRDVSTEVASQTKCSLIKSEETLVNLRLELSQAKANYAQLGEAFKATTDRVAVLDEEKLRLESLVAQLEMESATVGEYIAMFAHRRQLQAKRTRIREALLCRIVRDREELRQRLKTLSTLAQDVISIATATASSSLTRKNGVDLNADNGDYAAEGRPQVQPPNVDGCCSIKQHSLLMTLSSELSTFLQDLDTSPLEVLPNSGDEEEEVESASELPVTGSDHSDDRLHHRLSIIAAAGPLHDCPHCECCTGSLLVV